jgi:hypothetical protein
MCNLLIRVFWPELDIPHVYLYSKQSLELYKIIPTHTE